METKKIFSLLNADIKLEDVGIVNNENKRDIDKKPGMNMRDTIQQH